MGANGDSPHLLDNNLAENAIRPFTVSRKNFLFCGNHQAAENTAVICSLLATCKAQEVNPRLWLNDVIANLHRYTEKNSTKDLRDLLPHRWKMKNPQDESTLPQRILTDSSKFQ